MYRMEFQYRPDYAKPSAARDLRVRKAFYHTIDKEGVNAVEVAGLGKLADSWIPPDDSRYPRFRDVTPPWSRDFALAQRFLAEAGWQRGSDGILVHSGTVERMETEIRVTAGQGHVQAMAVMADGWRQVGAVVSEVAIPPAQVNNLEYRSTFPFTGLTGHTATLLWEASHFFCKGAARPETRWSGNRNGTCVAGADPLIEQLQVTVDEEQRTALQIEIMRLVLFEDYSQLPLWWQVTPIVFAHGITGPGEMSAGPYTEPRNLWNVHKWEKRG
jgi:ABC-type transport system substrate-binding protein